MGFPAGELKAIETDDKHPGRPATVRTRLLGLYGVDSPYRPCAASSRARRPPEPGTTAGFARRCRWHRYGR
jgi:predicted component of type VI protein secretion system